MYLFLNTIALFLEPKNKVSNYHNKIKSEKPRIQTKPNRCKIQKIKSNCASKDEDGKPVRIAQPRSLGYGESTVNMVHRFNLTV